MAVGFTGSVRAAKAVSVDGAANVYLSRRRVNQAFLEAALEDFHKNGAKVFERCAEEQPGTYLKVFALLMPKEHKVEHINPTNGLSDESLTAMVIELENRIAARLAGEGAKVIDAVAIAAPKPVKAKSKVVPGRKRGKDRKQRKLRGSPRTPVSP